MRLLLRGALLALLILALGPAAHAQAPDRQRAFVYGIQAALNSTYTGSFAPPSTSTIYLLADQTNLISPRSTLIYFWPITNEYQASWELLNEPVPGTLEIVQGGQVIQQTGVTSYTIHFDRVGSVVQAKLFLGEEAVAANQRFKEEQLAYGEAQRTYYTDRQAWLAVAGEINQRIANGEKGLTIPPAPVPPTPISVTSNGLSDGIPIRLPAGSYQIRLRGPDGAIVPSSERALEVFSPRRTTIGYSVVPETRWTTPDEINDPSAAIIGKANSQLYLIPRVVYEYPARPYTLLQNPQKQVSATSEWIWEAAEEVSASQLEVITDGGDRALRGLTPYSVKQSEGISRGYQIIPFVPDPENPGKRPDLTAFPLPLSGPGSSAQVQVMSPGSPPLAGLLLLAVAPLLVGAAIIIRRRARMRLPRNIAG